MPLTSNSTDAEVQAAMDDSVGYDLPGGGVAMCAEYISACRIRISRMAGDVSKGDARVVNQYQRIQAELEKALAWFGANSSTSHSRGVCRQIAVRSGRW